MKRFLFLTIPEKGHLNPMIGPAVWLQRMGHHVRFHAAENISVQLEGAGLKMVEDENWATRTTDENRGALFAQRVRDPVWLRQWIGDLLIKAAPVVLPALESVISRYQPSVIVTDPMIYPGAIAAHRAGIPWVALSNSLNPVLDDSITSDLLDTVRSLGPARRELFGAHGMSLKFRGCDMLSPHLSIVFTTQEFIGRSLADVEMVGPSLPLGQRGDEIDFPWEKLSAGKRRIYMSFGSQVYHQPDLFQKVITATAEMGVQLVISANELHGQGAFGDAPAHVLTCHTAPQLALLPKIDAFITHGGANSVMEALHFGVPMLISPICNDQFHQAHFIRRSSTGIELDLYQAGKVEIQDALNQLLCDAVIASNVRRVAKSYAVDGAMRAAELIAQVP